MNFASVFRGRAIAALLLAMMPLLVSCDVIEAQLGVNAPIPATTQTPIQTPTSVATLAASGTGTPSGASSEPDALPGEVVITVWMPDTLALTIETPGGEALLEQLVSFDETHPDIRVEFYSKRTTGPGSAVGYLRSAPPVAPGILPDLVLLDQERLLDAAREKLIVPLDDLVDPALVETLYPVARDLGTVDDQLFGLAYVLEFQHMVYRLSFFREPPNTFEAVLGNSVPYLFPAAPKDNVNLTTLTQYLAAGGSLVDAEGRPHLDAEPLREVLTFYAEGRSKGMIDPALFQISDTHDTWINYRDLQAGLATVSSTQYLADRQSVRTSTGLSWIPTPDGQPASLVTGWSWAVVATDPERQQAALELLGFLLDPVNQGTYTRAAAWLPSRPAALAVWGDTDRYLAFAEMALDAATVQPEATLLSPVGPAIQDAVEAVLLNNVLPVQAANDAALAVNGPSGGTP
jgi:ABC-type glycerol-3-phosphate transport system substrate-binding protein